MNTEDDQLEEAREEVAAHAEMFRERFLTTELALWAAMMSLAGIFISAASVVVAMSDKRSFAWLLGAVIVSGASMGMLVMNYRARRSLYRFLGQPPPDDIWDNRSAFAKYVEHARKTKADSVREQQKCELREKFVYMCLFLSGVLLVVGSWRSGVAF